MAVSSQAFIREALRRFLGRVTAPSPAISDPFEQRRAQLLIFLVLSAAVIGISLDLLWKLLVYGGAAVTDLSFWFDSLLILFIASLCYRFARSRHYRWAAFLTVTCLAVGAILVAATPTVGHEENGLLFYLIAPMIIATALFDRWQMVGMVVLILIIAFVGGIGIGFAAKKLLLSEMSFLFINGLLLMALSHWGLLRRWEYERSQLMIGNALDSSSDIVCIRDMDDKAVYLNAAFRQQLGYTLEDLGSQTMLRLFKDVQSADQARDDTLIWHGETELRTKDDRRLTFLLRANRIKAENNAVIGVLIIGTDITERKQIETTRQAVQREKERVREQQEFISGISHDLRSPLAILYTKADLLEAEPLSKNQRTHLGIMRQQMESMKNFIDELLTISQLEQKEFVLPFQPTALNDITQGVLNKLHPLAEEKGITITQDFAADLPHLMLAPLEIERALGNLIENAIRYTPAGGTIKVGTRLNEHMVTWEIQDSGIGIPENALPRIFDRFYRTREARKMQPTGTGLGLTISQKIIEVHGGAIEVSSQVGQGSLFRISLPVQPSYTQSS